MVFSPLVPTSIAIRMEYNLIKALIDTVSSDALLESLFNEEGYAKDIYPKSYNRKVLERRKYIAEIQMFLHRNKRDIEPT